MQILFIGFLSLFLSSSVWTQKMLRELQVHELIQVGLDNAAIILGRKDASLLTQLFLFNKKISTLEEAHHAVHFCKEIHCQALDKKLEVQINSAIEKMQITLQAMWVENLKGAENYLIQKHIKFQLDDRSGSAPVENCFCNICGIPNGLKTTFPFYSYLWRSIENEKISTKESIYITRTQWDYSLSPE